MLVYYILNPGENKLMSITTTVVLNFSQEKGNHFGFFIEFTKSEFNKKSYSKLHAKIGENYG